MAGRAAARGEAGHDARGRAELLMIWQGVAAKRSGIDAMMWQTPALGMFAQAFLLTLALESGSSRWARLVAAALSLVLSLMVLQLMAKHRRHEMLQSLLLERIEQRLGLDSALGAFPHGKTPHPDDAAKVDAALSRSTPGLRRYWRHSSYELWMMGMALFAVAALLVIGVVAAGQAGRIFG